MIKSIVYGILFFLPLVEPQAATDRENTRNLVHLLDYMAQDYGGAVSNGKIISTSEYAEQVEFAEKAWQIHFKIADSATKSSIEPGLSRLIEFIGLKADPSMVIGLSKELKQELIASSGISTAPMHWPSLQQGRELFSQNCVACHGQEGKGDGPAGQSLTPRPANFHDETRMSQLSPFQVFNTVKLGVDGTAMPAFPQLDEKDIWDLSFFIVSLRYAGDSTRAKVLSKKRIPIELQKLSFSSDRELSARLQGKDTLGMLAVWRLLSGEQAQTLSHFLELAKLDLERAQSLYRVGKNEESRDTALFAYLEGVEPIEPRLKAIDPAFVTQLEMAMMTVRNSIQSKQAPEKVDLDVGNAKKLLLQAEELLQSKAMPPWMIFLITVGILLRESFEALLVIIAILGVVNAAKSEKAAKFVHGGWLSAVLAGVLAWFFSGWVARISGAGREITEGISSLFAVAVLLYMGFWMHSKSEIGKWKIFIDEKVQSIVNSRSLLGLAAFSFLVVFREAFETVLFLSALSMEGEGAGKPILVGALVSLGFTLIIAWIFLRMSKRIPVRLFFSISSFVMAFLAIILSGKGLHALQEAGIIGITPAPFHFRSELAGFYPTYETSIAQVVIFLAALFLLRRPKKISVA